MVWQVSGEKLHVLTGKYGDIFTGNTLEDSGTVATIQMCLLFLPGTCHHTGNNLGQKGKSGLPVSVTVSCSPHRVIKHQAQIELQR